jgi:hypothetical protein
MPNIGPFEIIIVLFMLALIAGIVAAIVSVTRR